MSGLQCPAKSNEMTDRETEKGAKWAVEGTEKHCCQGGKQCKLTVKFISFVYRLLSGVG